MTAPKSRVWVCRSEQNLPHGEHAVEFALVRFGGLLLGPDVGGQVGSAPAISVLEGIFHTNWVP